MDMYNSGVKRSNDGAGADSSKRQKASSAEPSKVLHVRGLPSYCTEAEIKSVVAPFGQVMKCFLMLEKHQAFIQMETVQAAQELLNNLEYSQPSIRSKPIYFQFSARTEVESKATTNGAEEGVGANGSSPVILLTISNVTVPVTLDNIHAICKPYGEVHKIICFTKGADFQALVQMASVDAALNAQRFLEGKDMFQGCCHIRVGFSKRNNLMIKENSHKSRDLTQASGSSAYSGMIGGMGMGGMAQMGQMGQMGGMGQMGMGQMGMGQMGGPMGGPMGGFGQMQQPRMGGFGSPVVLVNKLNPDLINADILFALFGLYGDVIRVKVLYNKRDTAMVQFHTPDGAAAAVANLNGCPLHGQNLMVTASKHADVKLPRGETDSDSGLTKDYTSSDLHRYKLAGNPVKNVNAPSQVLHVANLHENGTAQEIRDLFQSAQPHSDSQPVVEFFKTSKKMAYVGMCSVETAVEAMITLHNRKLNGWPIRVSFSPKDPSSLKDDSQ